MFCITFALYSKFQQEPSVFNKDLTEWSLTRAKTKGKSLLVIHKSGRGRLREWSLTGAFDYKVLVTSQTGFHNPGRN